MRLAAANYTTQSATWPQTGKHILAQYDSDSIIVYQAYRPAIGHFAATNGYFGGEFKLSRMSWIKPNFLWMMYRSGWGTKAGQEVTLAIRLRRSFFDRLLTLAVASSFGQSHTDDHSAWEKMVASSEVRLQWDPDHNPLGKPLARRAVQLGLRGEILREFSKNAIVEIEDISPFVAEQRENTGNLADLITPAETLYSVEQAEARTRLGL